MKSIDFIVILTTMAHPNGTFFRGRFLDKIIPDVTLASAQTLQLAFLQISDI